MRLWYATRQSSLLLTRLKISRLEPCGAAMRSTIGKLAERDVQGQNATVSNHRAQSLGLKEDIVYVRYVHPNRSHSCHSEPRSRSCDSGLNATRTAPDGSSLGCSTYGLCQVASRGGCTDWRTGQHTARGTRYTTGFTAAPPVIRSGEPRQNIVQAD
jgi:hypothetical protein